MVEPLMKTKNPSSSTVKFLCSYGGKILPRYPDGKLRYHGGETRVIAVQRSISFYELVVKLEEMCGTPVSLRCQLPTEDLDALVSVTSDEDLSNIIEEYDLQAASKLSATKIRAFLAPKPPKRVSPSTSSASSSASIDAASPKSTLRSSCMHTLLHNSERFMRQLPRNRFCKKVVGNLPNYGYHGYGNTSHIYLVHNGNYWQ